MPVEDKVYTKDMEEWLQFMVKSGLVEQMKEHISELEKESNNLWEVKENQIKEIRNQILELRKNIGNLIMWSMKINDNREVLQELIKALQITEYAISISYGDELLGKLDQKDGDACSARQTEKKDPYYPLWISKDEIVVEKADLEWLFGHINYYEANEIWDEFENKRIELEEKYLGKREEDDE